MVGTKSVPHHHWSEAERDIVRRDYDGTSESARRLAQRLGVTYYAVKGQIQRLCVTKARRVRWTPQEDATLRELLGKFATIMVARKMHRTQQAIEARAKRLRISRWDKDGWYNKREVSEILGADHKWLQSRIDNGSLVASWHHEHKPGQNGSGSWHFSERSLKDFIRSHPDELTGRNVDMVQIVDLLIGVQREKEAHERERE